MTANAIISAIIAALCAVAIIASFPFWLPQTIDTVTIGLIKR